MTWNIVGLQHVGVGVTDAKHSLDWYIRNFGMDIKVFDDVAQAYLMTPYTGGESHERRSIMTLNLRGGGAMELVQPTRRAARPPVQALLLGDCGVTVVRIKADNVSDAHRELVGRGADLLGPVQHDPAGSPHFLARDDAGNHYQIVEAKDWFSKRGGTMGGVAGCCIGVTDVSAARRLYSDILGYDEVVYDEEGVFADLSALPGGDRPVRRVLLRHSGSRSGGLSQLLGTSQLELVVALDRTPARALEKRMWGDLGFVHLTFDVSSMSALLDACDKAGFKTTVDSGTSSWHMENAAGRFAYIEDPDGTLVEFIETHKIPLFKPLGIAVDLRKRDASRPLPSWIIKLMALRRVRA